ncbi:MAG TPA: GatB/YqeY domain-containing protein [Candidatus Mcinerneyibacteriales bacterium]|nr:GatB/YqeY domain-containing protein [Candidatus Mcinerneyibacteriales bacterium]
MTLEERLKTDLTRAMKEKDEVKTSTLRMLISDIRYAQIEKRAPLTDEDIQAVISKSVKKHQDSIEMYSNGGRDDLAQREEAEIEILKSYLPRQLSRSEIAQLVEEAIMQTGASSRKEMGKVMQALMPQVKGKADGKLVSSVVQEKLAE